MRCAIAEEVEEVEQEGVRMEYFDCTGTSAHTGCAVSGAVRTYALGDPD